MSGLEISSKRHLPCITKIIGIYEKKKKNSLDISKFPLALQPEALVNTSGRVLFSRPGCVGAPVTLCTPALLLYLHSCLGLYGGMLPRKIFDKNGVIWCNLGRPKVCYYHLKLNNFKGKKSTRKLN